jgi:acid stress-induced BolA-like protein IbaG/YrbA
MNSAQIEQLIRVALPDAQIQVQSDDNTHFSALIVSDAFAGKRTLQRHQIVYAALGTRMGNEIHALSMQTLSVAEAQSQGTQQ